MLELEPDKVIDQREEDPEDKGSELTLADHIDIEHHVEGYYADCEVEEIRPQEHHKEGHPGIDPKNPPSQHEPRYRIIASSGSYLSRNIIDVLFNFMLMDLKLFKLGLNLRRYLNAAVIGSMLRATFPFIELILIGSNMSKALNETERGFHLGEDHLEVSVLFLLLRDLFVPHVNVALNN